MFFPTKSLCCRSTFPTSPYVIARTLHLVRKKKYIKPSEESMDGATTAYLQVLGSGAADEPASVLLNTQNTRYLFNCGEGIGRTCKNSGISLGNIRHAFFTQSKWDRIGGVTHLFFSTIANMGYLPTFYGPGELYKIFRRMSFLSVIGSEFDLRFTDQYFKNDRFEDSKMVIEPVELKHQNDTAIVYVCKLKACQGKISVEKSVKKNVPAHLIKNLYRGEDVILDDGTIVKNSDVKNGDWPEMYFIGEFGCYFFTVVGK